MGFTLQQFSEVLSVRTTDGLPYILVGGQAVNYWAERYLVAEPQLAPLQPFTSEDIDFKGGKNDVQRIAQQLQLPATYPPKVAMTALAGAIPFKIGDLKSNIEIVRMIPGVSEPADPFAIEAEWEGNTIRVLNPISLLACKLWLAAKVSQEDRNDVQHLKILVLCVRAFLNEILEQVEIGEIPARDWLGAANQVLKLTKTKPASKIGLTHQIDWQAILPIVSITKSQNGQIQRFWQHQLAQCHQTDH